MPDGGGSRDNQSWLEVEKSESMRSEFGERLLNSVHHSCRWRFGILRLTKSLESELPVPSELGANFHLSWPEDPRPRMVIGGRSKLMKSKHSLAKTKFAPYLLNNASVPHINDANVVTRSARVAGCVLFVFSTISRQQSLPSWLYRLIRDTNHIWQCFRKLHLLPHNNSKASAEVDVGKGETISWS